MLIWFSYSQSSQSPDSLFECVGRHCLAGVSLTVASVRVWMRFTGRKLFYCPSLSASVSTPKWLYSTKEQRCTEIAVIVQILIRLRCRLWSRGQAGLLCSIVKIAGRAVNASNTLQQAAFASRDLCTICENGICTVCDKWFSMYCILA